MARRNRATLRDRHALIAPFAVGQKANSFRKFLVEKCDVHGLPAEKTMELFCFHAHLLDDGKVKSMVDGVARYAANENVKVDPETFNMRHAVVEFDTAILGLGGAIAEYEERNRGPEDLGIAELARNCGLGEQTLRLLASGPHILVPADAAMKVANFAQGALTLGKPLEIQKIDFEDDRYAPLASETIETIAGANAHRCKKTVSARKDILKLIR